MTEKNFNQYLQQSDTSTISLVYSSEDLSDKDLIEISIYTIEPQKSNNNLDSLIDKKTPKIIFKIKKYYIICIQNRRNIDFDMSETVAKNILIYGVFNKEDWEQEAKKYDYKYLNQISENWKNKIQIK